MIFFIISNQLLDKVLAHYCFKPTTIRELATLLRKKLTDSDKAILGKAIQVASKTWFKSRRRVLLRKALHAVSPSLGKAVDVNSALLDQLLTAYSLRAKTVHELKILVTQHLTPAQVKELREQILKACSVQDNANIVRQVIQKIFQPNYLDISSMDDKEVAIIVELQQDGYPLWEAYEDEYKSFEDLRKALACYIKYHGEENELINILRKIESYPAAENLQDLRAGLYQAFKKEFEVDDKILSRLIQIIRLNQREAQEKPGAGVVALIQLIKDIEQQKSKGQPVLKRAALSPKVLETDPSIQITGSKSVPLQQNKNLQNKNQTPTFFVKTQRSNPPPSPLQVKKQQPQPLRNRSGYYPLPRA